MSLLDSFTWAPGVGMLDTAKNTSFQAGAAQDFAKADLTNTQNAAAQAELQDYISQSAKDLRETTRQAEIGKAKEQIANSESLSNYFKNNEGARDEMTALKVHKEITGMNKGISDDQAALEHTSTSKWYDVTTGKADVAAYLKERPNMIKNGLGTEKDLPTAEDLQNNPEALTALTKAGAASAYTQEQKVAQATAATKAATDMKLQQYEQGQQNYRTQYTQEHEDARTKLIQESTDARWSNKYQMMKDIADKKAQATAKGSAMKLGDFGNVMEQRFEAGKVADRAFQALGLNIDANTAETVKAKLWAATESEYAAQKSLFDKHEISTHPASPEDIYESLLQQSLENPKQIEKGMPVFKTGKLTIDRPQTTNEVKTDVKDEVKAQAEAKATDKALDDWQSHVAAMPAEGRGQQTDPAYGRKLAAWKAQGAQILKGTGGLNKNQMNLMQDENFQRLTRDEQKEALSQLK